MADNDTVKDGNNASVTVANDDIGGVKYPRFKATWGPDGTANDTDVASGKSFPVQLRKADGTAIGLGDATNGLLVDLGANNDVVVAGDVAAAATDSGNPVKIGGVNSTTLPTLTDGQRGNVQLDTRGGIFVSLKAPNSASNIAAQSAGADNVSNSTVGISAYSFGMVFDGSTWDRMLGDSTNGVLVNLGANNDVVAGHNTTGIGHGVKTVTTAGTDVALASTTAAKWVTIQAQTDNTNYIAVGATGVDATVATGTGIMLAAGDSITIPCDDLAEIFIDSLVNGEGVRFTYGT